MTFAELRRQYLDAVQTQDKLRAIFERRWPLGRDPFARLANEVICREVALFIGSYGDDNYTPVVIAHIVGDDLQRYPAATLRKIAAMKALVELWVAGELVSVPTELPAYIAEMPTR